MNYEMTCRHILQNRKSTCPFCENGKYVSEGFFDTKKGVTTLNLLKLEKVNGTR